MFMYRKIYCYSGKLKKWKQKLDTPIFTELKKSSMQICVQSW